MSRTCHSCGSEYKNLSSHWTRSDCDYPDLDPWKIETIQGMLLGDGCITHGPKNAYFVTSMTNKAFLEHINNELGWLTDSVNLYDSQQTGSSELYRLQTMAAPHFNTMRERWYSDGEKTIPKSRLTKREVKLWYVCDGCMAWGPRVKRASPRFTIVTLDDDREVLINTLEEQGIEVTNRSESVSITADSTDRFLEWIGDPLPGFEYKWVNNDRSLYEEKKRKV